MQYIAYIHNKYFNFKFKDNLKSIHRYTNIFTFKNKIYLKYRFFSTTNDNKYKYISQNDFTHDANGELLYLAQILYECAGINIYILVLDTINNTEIINFLKIYTVMYITDDSIKSIIYKKDKTDIIHTNIYYEELLYYTLFFIIYFKYINI